MNFIKKIISYPLSVVFYLLFGLVLVIFHAIQWTALKVFGEKAHKKTVDYLNVFILGCLSVLGNTFSYKNEQNLPVDRPLIIVSNHQSMFDIPLIVWFMRKYNTKFISKIELGKGIPSISFNLRHGGNALIDRKNPKQSIPELARFAKYVSANNFAAVIFPEGTRSRNGNPKKFAHTGLKILFKHCPEALVVPVTINNSWKLVRHGNFPMGVGIRLSLEVHKPIEMDTMDAGELLETIESRVTQAIRT